MGELSGDVIKLSIVIPAFNEEARLEATLRAVEAWANHAAGLIEVVVVDDGSTDSTRQVAREWERGEKDQSAQSVLKVVLHPDHRGKGSAVARGVLRARGAVRVFMDADLAIPLMYVDRIVEEIRRGADVVIGSRELEGSRRRGEPWLRHAMGRGFNRFVAQLAIGGFRDTQCGLKGFSADAAEDICQRVRLYPRDAEIIAESRVTAFDVEILAIARRHSWHIVEIPVDWSHMPVSKVRPFQDAFLMIVDALKVRWNLWLRRYG